MPGAGIFFSLLLLFPLSSDAVFFHMNRVVSVVHSCEKLLHLTALFFIIIDGLIVRTLCMVTFASKNMRIKLKVWCITNLFSSLFFPPHAFYLSLIVVQVLCLPMSDYANRCTSHRDVHSAIIHSPYRMSHHPLIPR